MQFSLWLGRPACAALKHAACENCHLCAIFSLTPLPERAALSRDCCLSWSVESCFCKCLHLAPCTHGWTLNNLRRRWRIAAIFKSVALRPARLKVTERWCLEMAQIYPLMFNSKRYSGPSKLINSGLLRQNASEVYRSQSLSRAG